MLQVARKALIVKLHAEVLQHPSLEVDFHSSTLAEVEAIADHEQMSNSDIVTMFR